jgi:hypothetical protein
MSLALVYSPVYSFPPNTMASLTHMGSWDSLSRQSLALNFVEKYEAKVASLDLTLTPSSAFYAPLAIFRNTGGDVRIGGPSIWEWLSRLMSPFERVHNDVVEARVFPGTEKRELVVHAEFLTHFLLRGDEQELVAPRFFIFTLGAAGAGEGTDGMQIQEVRLFWDTGIIGRYVSDRRKREQENGGRQREGSSAI